MSRIFHCILLLYIVFVIAETRNVLLYTDLQQTAPVTIWEEIQHSPTDNGAKQNFFISHLWGTLSH